MTLVARLAYQGAILAYHAAFERERLHDLACLLPELEGPLFNIANRLVDLEAIIVKHVYHPAFHGTFSLKSVLPALVPHCSYEGLAIKDGGAAALAYEQLRMLPHGPEKDRLREQLNAYCAQDTWGLVQIYRLLRGLSPLGSSQAGQVDRA